jgi:hypothetical protein
MIAGKVSFKLPKLGKIGNMAESRKVARSFDSFFGKRGISQVLDGKNRG